MPPNFVVGRCWRPLRASRREDWQIEHPGRGRDAPACHCHPTRAGGQGPARRREQGGQVRQAGANRRWPPPGWGQPCMAQRGRSMAWGACSSPVRSAGLRGAASPVSPPAFWACNPLRTRSPGAGPTGVATWAATRRQRGPSAPTRQRVRWRHRCRRAWHGARQPGRTGAARPSNVAGSLWRAGRRPTPTRAVGPSVRLRLVVLSKPSVRAPRTRDAGAGARAARGHAP
jgi:hypothetical protein